MMGRKAFTPKVVYRFSLEERVPVLATVAIRVRQAAQWYSWCRPPKPEPSRHRQVCDPGGVRVPSQWLWFSRGLPGVRQVARVLRKLLKDR